VPYVVTVVVVMFTDLLLGIAAGVVVSACFILRSLYTSQGFTVQRHGRLTRFVLEDEVTFFHKARLADELEKVPAGSLVEIDGSKSRTIDLDVIDTLQTFRKRAAHSNIEVIVGGTELMESYTPEQMEKIEAEYNEVLASNRSWAAEQSQLNPKYFSEHSRKGQEASFLFIGCSDMAISAENIVRTSGGRLLVHRNIANLVSPHDVNLMSVLQYSIDILNIPHIVVCGHYDCEFVREAMTQHSMGLIDNWISPIKHTANQHKAELDALSGEDKHRRLVELHALQQARNLLKLSVVQRSLLKMGTPRIHAWVYDPDTGLIKDLKTKVSLKEDLEEIYQYANGVV
jgi:carbonic anhydrase